MSPLRALSLKVFAVDMALDLAVGHFIIAPLNILGSHGGPHGLFDLHCPLCGMNILAFGLLVFAWMSKTEEEKAEARRAAVAGARLVRERALMPEREVPRERWLTVNQTYATNDDTLDLAEIRRREK